jgi:hypothetical protein
MPDALGESAEKMWLTEDRDSECCWEMGKRSLVGRDGGAVESTWSLADVVVGRGEERRITASPPGRRIRGAGVVDLA